MLTESAKQTISLESSANISTHIENTGANSRPVLPTLSTRFSRQDVLPNREE
jgi:hypothetical protein